MNFQHQASRRGFLRQTGLLALAVSAVALLPRMAQAAWNKTAFFSAKTLEDAYKAGRHSPPKARTSRSSPPTSPKTARWRRSRRSARSPTPRRFPS